MVGSMANRMFSNVLRGSVMFEPLIQRQDQIVERCHEAKNAQDARRAYMLAKYRDLVAELALNGGDHFSLLTSSKGQACDADSLGRWFADAIDEAGLPDDCAIHGLRKTAARMLSIGAD